MNHKWLKVGMKLKHFKGGKYEVIAFGMSAYDCTDVVVYKSLTDGLIWVRNASEFDDLVKWDDGIERTRFIKCDDL